MKVEHVLQRIHCLNANSATPLVPPVASEDGFPWKVLSIQTIKVGSFKSITNETYYNGTPDGGTSKVPMSETTSVSYDLLILWQRHVPEKSVQDYLGQSLVTNKEIKELASWS